MDKTEIKQDKKTAESNSKNNQSNNSKSQKKTTEKPEEIGGPTGPEPTRYGDWEKNGRVSDF